MIPTLIPEPATVYRGSRGRRFFTKRGAYRSIAWAAIREKYPPTYEPPDYEAGIRGGWECDIDYDRAGKLAQRLARWLEWRDRRAAELAALCPCKTKNEEIAAGHLPECPWSDPHYQPPGGMF